MDKNQFEQLKKLVMDMDKSLTRLKSFIDQHESEPGFDTFNDDFGFPPLPSRRANPFGASPAGSTSPFDDAIRAPLKRSEPVASDMSMPPLRQDAAKYSAPLQRQDANPRPVNTNSVNQPLSQPVPSLPPKPVAPVPSTNTVLSPSDASSVNEEIEGTFDGQFLVSSSGQKMEVPASYASKSRILFGDVVRAYKEGGEQKFTVTTKQPRKKLKALTAKKEGKWYVVTGLGSYKIADSTAEFNNLQLNQEVNVLVPENNTMVPFAAFDEVYAAQPKPAQSPAVAAPVNNNVKNNAPRAQQPQQAQQGSMPPRVQQSSQQSQPSQSRPAERSGPYRTDKNPRPNTSAQPKPSAQPAVQPVAPSAPVDPALKIMEDFDLV